MPSYSLYPVLVEIQDGRSTVIEFDRSMRLPLERIAASTAKAFFLTSPNAPTGVGFANAEIEQALQAFRGIFVVDEAYAPFARENAVPLLARYPRLVVVRTLSKSYALAGMRVGYALADPEVIDVLDRVRDSYNVNRLSQVAAIAALERPGLLRGRRRTGSSATRDRFLRDSPGAAGSPIPRRRTSSSPSRATPAARAGPAVAKAPTISSTPTRCSCATSPATP
jgi:histidinol-phosphate aminotransferase